jgi:phosphohistidine phosphatase SixA
MQKPNAPKDLATKAASFRSQLGQFEQARQNLALMIMTTDDAKAREKMLASFKNIAPKGMAEELAAATEQFRTLHVGHHPGLSDHLFILLGGPPPNATIDFADLATERSLFGADDTQGTQLFE